MWVLMESPLPLRKFIDDSYYKKTKGSDMVTIINP